MTKEIAPEVVAFQARMFANRLRLTKVLAAADIAPSTWSRWVKGSQPNTSTMRKANAAIDAILAERHLSATSGVRPHIEPEQPASPLPSGGAGDGGLS